MAGAVSAAAKATQGLAGGVKHLDAPVHRIGDEQPLPAVGGQVGGVVQLARAAAAPAEARDELPVEVEDHDLVGGGVGHKKLVAQDRQPGGALQAISQGK